jgi:hypothetical protein
LTTVKQQTYVENFGSLGTIAAEKLETDGRTDGQTDRRTDGRHNDFSRAHFFKNGGESFANNIEKLILAKFQLFNTFLTFFQENIRIFQETT